jgi:hypothetical protein
MTYVGALRGEGMLLKAEAASNLGRAEYDIDGFLDHTKAVVASGEIRMEPLDLGNAFGVGDVVLESESGLRLVLRFSSKQLPPGTTAAHVDVIGGLPTKAEWPS